MKTLLILGAGTAGTTVANRLQRRLPAGWRLSVVDPDDSHLYQPGLLFLPFGARDENKITRSRARTLLADVPWIRRAVERVEPDRRRVVLRDGDTLAYDLLVIASGELLRPAETPGLAQALAERTVHDFYTLGGAAPSMTSTTSTATSTSTATTSAKTSTSSTPIPATTSCTTPTTRSTTRPSCRSATRRAPTSSGVWACSK